MNVYKQDLQKGIRFTGNVYTDALAFFHHHHQDRTAEHSKRVKKSG
nr:hypothetical protein [Bacillus swezeyi]